MTRPGETFDAIRAAGPLNIVWGAGCSEYRSTHEALMSLPPERRAEKADAYGVNWAQICLAGLLRAGRVARLLSANFDRGIVKSITLADVLPEQYEGDFPQLAESVVPSVYCLANADPHTVAALIERGAQTGPWLVIGCSGKHFGLGDAMRAVPHFEHGLWWVGHFDQPPPEALGPGYFAGERGAHFISGFDAASFLAYLIRAVSQFPPAFVVDQSSTRLSCQAASDDSHPGAQLYRWCSNLSDQIYRLRDGYVTTARDLVPRASAAHGSEYAELISQLIRAWEFYSRWSKDSAGLGARYIATVAKKRSPREAEPLLRKALEWSAKFPPQGEFGTDGLAGVYCDLARFRTGPAAVEEFEAANRAFAAVAPAGNKGFLLESWANILFTWAGQERAPETLDRARQKYREACELEPSKTERPMRFAQALWLAAGWAGPGLAPQLLADAREIIGERKDGLAWHLRGLIAVRGGSPGEAAPCFAEALALRPADRATILSDWAAVLGEFAATQRGEEALHLFAQAEEKFRDAEEAKPNSAPLHKNWSSILILEARARGGAAEVFERAHAHAETADSIDPGAGAYNLACIAAESGDSDAVRGWLREAAAHARIMPLSHILRDASFQRFRADPGFTSLLTEIFGNTLLAPSS